MECMTEKVVKIILMYPKPSNLSLYVCITHILGMKLIDGKCFYKQTKKKQQEDRRLPYTIKLKNSALFKL